MHIHSSFSEKNGSMDAHLYQAAQNGVDVVWWTDHDQRINALGYRKTVHFTSLDAERPARGEGSAWKWQPRSSGPLASSSGRIVATPCSPHDPQTGGALHVAAKSASRIPAAYGYFANAPDVDYHCTLDGQKITIDVMPAAGWWSEGYLEVLIDTSVHAPSGGRPAGAYSLSYRIGPAPAKPARALGLAGIVHRVAPRGRWTTVTLTPSQDIAVLWPDLDSRDFSSAGITLRAVSTGNSVAGYFDYLRFTRTVTGEAALRVQQDMAAALAGRYPAVMQQQGLEVSLRIPATAATYPHMNWFGGSPAIQDYGTMNAAEWRSWLAGTLVPLVHSDGGLVSFNHPYGTGQGTLAQAQQDQMLTQEAAALVPSGDLPACLGADLLEVGYPQRGGCDLAHHVALWDILSRNACFLTGTGVSDDHVGSDWAGFPNNWVTSAWSASAGQGDLLAALAAGRAYCGSLSAPPVALDLLVDGTVPMGAVSVSSLTSRHLAITASGLPPGWSVALMQGDVDYAGTSGLESSAQQVGSFSPGDLDGTGRATVTVDTSTSSYLRTQLVDPDGNTQALSNPVWLLDAAPPDGIPAPRQA